MGGDSNYIYPALVLLANIKEQEIDLPILFLYFKDDLSLPHQQTLMSVAGEMGLDFSLRQIEVPSLKSQDLSNYISRSTFTRLLAPSLEDYSGYIWIDLDLTLICSKSELVSTFFPAPRNGRVVAAEQWAPDSSRRLSLISPSYFNAGIYSYCGDNRETPAYFDVLNQADSLELLPDDQDVLNFCHREDIHLVPNYWNTHGLKVDVLENQKQAKVIHYTGNTKPWHQWASSSSKCITSHTCGWSWFYKNERVLLTLPYKEKTLLKVLKRLRRDARRGGHPDRLRIAFSAAIGILMTIFPMLPGEGRLSSLFSDHAHPWHRKTGKLFG